MTRVAKAVLFFIPTLMLGHMVSGQWKQGEQYNLNEENYTYRVLWETDQALYSSIRINEYRGYHHILTSYNSHTYVVYIDNEYRPRIVKVSPDGTSIDAFLDSAYYNKIYSFSFRYLQNRQDTEGVVQEVFIILWNSREKVKDIKNLNAWLFTVTFNQIRKIFRNIAIEKRIMETVTISSIFDDTSVISEIEFNDLKKKAEHIIERLTPRRKKVLLLSIREGLSSTEISRKLRITKRTVENHLSSSRVFLKNAFKEEHLIPLVVLWLSL